MDFDWNVVLITLAVSAWVFILILLVFATTKFLFEDKHIKCMICLFPLCVWFVFPMVMGIPMRLSYGW